MARSANDDEPAKQTIFIAFDASELAATQAREWRNTLIVLSALAAVLLATLLAFFWHQRYQRSHRELLDAMKRKESWWRWGIWRRASRTKFVTRSRPSKGWRNTLPSARQPAASRMNWRR